jgi:molecular chaperone DnaK
MGRVIGIDLGTTNSCVAVMEDGQPVVIPNTGGYRTTPSYFAVADDGKRLVGHLAKRQAITNSANTIYNAKRLIGRGFDSPEAQRLRSLCPYEIVEGPNNDCRVEVSGRVYTIPEISAIVLREMKRVAEEYLGEPVEQAVITVPAYFNDPQRQTTKDAGKIAGLEVLRILNEPTAAALAYGMNRDVSEKIAVFDMGGGTFDISILELSDEVLEVIATAGDTFLGGEDIDLLLVDRMAQIFLEQEGIDLKQDTMALQRLKDACEKAKCDLSHSGSTEIHLPFIAADENGGAKHFSHTMTREELEELTGELVEKTRAICEGTLEDARLGVDDICQVILVGGQTRMPLVQRVVSDFFGKAPHKGVNPDEVVAVGAAIQGAMLTERADGPLLVDVTPLSLGIATFGGHMARVIERNTTVPTSKQQIFTTTRDDQPAVKIRVLQGENDQARENDLLGEFVLTGIREAPAGEPEIEVTFSIDANGIVSVSATDLSTGQAQSIQVNPRGTLDPSELEKLVDEYSEEEIAVKG